MTGTADQGGYMGSADEAQPLMRTYPLLQHVLGPVEFDSLISRVGGAGQKGLQFSGAFDADVTKTGDGVIHNYVFTANGDIPYSFLSDNTAAKLTIADGIWRVRHKQGAGAMATVLKLSEVGLLDAAGGYNVAGNLFVDGSRNISVHSITIV